MAWPADHFLPAKSISQDGPVTGDERFFRAMQDQIEGVRLMLNERISYIRIVPGSISSPVSAFPVLETYQGRTRTLINDLRAKILVVARNYIKTSTYSGGDIDGVNASTDVSWGTLNHIGDLLSYLGIGVEMGDGKTHWTNVPADNPFGWDADGYDTLRISATNNASPPLFKEHINEMYLCLQALTHVKFYGLAKDESGGTGSNYSFGMSSIGGINGYNEAEADFDVFGFFPQFLKFNVNQSYGTFLYSVKGVYKYDFSIFSDLVSCKTYVMSSVFTSDYSPPVTVDGKWHLQDTISSPSGTYLSDVYGDQACPAYIDETGTHGWQIGGSVAVLEPTFTYT